jgi:hypothetical protein
MPDEGFDPLRIAAALRARDVAYVLAGGLAATARGSAIATAEVEICVADDDGNLWHLGLALEDLAAVPEPGEQDDDHRVTFMSTAGRFVVIEVPEGYGELRTRAIDTDLGHGVIAPVAAVEDLVDLARASGDLEAAAHLASFVDAGADAEDETAAEDRGPDEQKTRTTDRVWSALERVDSFLSDLDTRGPKRRRGD